MGYIKHAVYWGQQSSGCVEFFLKISIQICFYIGLRDKEKEKCDTKKIHCDPSPIGSVKRIYLQFLLSTEDSNCSGIKCTHVWLIRCCLLKIATLTYWISISKYASCAMYNKHWKIIDTFSESIEEHWQIYRDFFRVHWEHLK